MPTKTSYATSTDSDYEPLGTFQGEVRMSLTVTPADITEANLERFSQETSAIDTEFSTSSNNFDGTVISQNSTFCGSSDRDSVNRDSITSLFVHRHKSVVSITPLTRRSLDLSFEDFEQFKEQQQVMIAQVDHCSSSEHGSDIYEGEVANLQKEDSLTISDDESDESDDSDPFNGTHSLSSLSPLSSLDERFSRRGSLMSLAAIPTSTFDDMCDRDIFDLPLEQTARQKIGSTRSAPARRSLNNRGKRSTFEYNKKTYSWELVNQLRSDTLQGFWEDLSSEMVHATPHLQDVLTSTLDVPVCNCHNKCSLAFCNKSGDLFFVCNTKTCKTVLFAKERPVTSTLDIGIFVPFGKSSMDRYTTLPNIMPWCGYIFTQKYLKDLFDRGEDADFPEGSYPAKDGDEYDLFLSYRGAAGRCPLWTALAARFHTGFAFAFLTLFCPILMGFLMLLHDPCDAGVPSWFLKIEEGDCKNLAEEDRAWFIFESYGALIALIILLFWYPLCFWTFPKFNVFFDKFCVHQSNCTLNTCGIGRLPLFLMKSKKLMCLFDEEWTTRLWCVWELAVYLKLRPNPEVEFVSISQRQLETYILGIVLFFTFIDRLISHIEDYDLTDDCGESDCIGPLDWIQSFFWLIVTVFFFFLAQKHFRAQEKLKTAIKTYDCRQAQVSKQEVKDTLLQYVEELFVSDVPNEDGLDTFNNVVKKSVPEHISLTGLRSWKCMSYMAAVLAATTMDITMCLDYIGYSAKRQGSMVELETPYHWNSATFHSMKDGDFDFTKILASLYAIFVVWPLSWFFLGALAKAFLLIQEKLRPKVTKVGYYCIVGVAFLLWFGLEMAFSVRASITVNILYNSVIALTGDTSTQYQIYYAPSYTRIMGDAWFSVTFDNSITRTILFWFFCIVPTFWFAWYVYEPLWSRRLRQAWWKKIYGWLLNNTSLSHKNNNQGDEKVYSNHSSVVVNIELEDLKNNLEQSKTFEV